MIVLDHNIPEHQVEQLRRWKVRCRQIGFEVGRPEWQDEQEILRYLHRQKHATFVTRDLGFFRPRLCHASYCIVLVTGPVLETSSMVRSFLTKSEFRTRARRSGKVVRLSTSGIAWYSVRQIGRRHISW